MTEQDKGSVPQSGRGAFSSGVHAAQGREIERRDRLENPEMEEQNPAARPETEKQNPAARPETEKQNPAARPETEERNPAARPETEEQNPAARPETADTPVLCPVCGGPAEGFGSFSIREGLLCGDCAGKLSEWFPCRPDTAAADIRAQMAYREENRKAAGTFHTSKILWSAPCIALDTARGTFQISSQRGRTANPDILSFRQIRGCQTEIAEQRKELFRPGRERFRPRRYEYRFEIYVRVLVDHPFFHEMRFRLHDRPIVVSDRMVSATPAGKAVKSPEYQRYRRAGEEICSALQKAMEQAREEIRREEDGSAAGNAETAADAGKTETVEKTAYPI